MDSSSVPAAIQRTPVPLAARKDGATGLNSTPARFLDQFEGGIWGKVAVTQAFPTLSEVIGHADLLVNEGRVREVDDGDVIHYEVVKQQPRT